MPMESAAQRRWMWATHPEMAERWEKETPKGKKLPEHKKKKFGDGFKKHAVTDLPNEANIEASWPLQLYVPGSTLEKETGQPQKKSTRTGVLNEDRTMNPKYRHQFMSKGKAD
jgi:hypothetical protein